jgi:hypothetical protein
MCAAGCSTTCELELLSFVESFAIELRSRSSLGLLIVVRRALSS